MGASEWLVWGKTADDRVSSSDEKLTAQDCLFQFVDITKEHEWGIVDIEYSLQPMFDRTDQRIAAPTAQEILDRLPNEIIGDDGMRFDLNIYRGEYNIWVACYWWDEDSIRKSVMFMKNITDKILAEVAVKMWLYLKKEWLLIL